MEPPQAKSVAVGLWTAMPASSAVTSSPMSDKLMPLRFAPAFFLLLSN
jgi:hypothetical protein